MLYLPEMERKFDLKRSEEKINEYREMVKKEAEKRRRKELESQRKQKNLQLAIETIAAVLPFQLTSGIDQDEYQVELESRGLQPKPGESPKELLQRSINICISNGKSPMEVSGAIVRDERVRTANIFGNEYSKESEERDIGLLAGLISKYYPQVKSKH